LENKFKDISKPVREKEVSTFASKQRPKLNEATKHEDTESSHSSSKKEDVDINVEEIIDTTFKKPKNEVIVTHFSSSHSSPKEDTDQDYHDEKFFKINKESTSSKTDNQTKLKKKFSVHLSENYDEKEMMFKSENNEIYDPIHKPNVNTQTPEVVTKTKSVDVSITKMQMGLNKRKGESFKNYSNKGSTLRGGLNISQQQADYKHLSSMEQEKQKMTKGVNYSPNVYNNNVDMSRESYISKGNNQAYNTQNMYSNSFVSDYSQLLQNPIMPQTVTPQFNMGNMDDMNFGSVNNSDYN
jgi:hypothetical protein